MTEIAVNGRTVRIVDALRGKAGLVISNEAVALLSTMGDPEKGFLHDSEQSYDRFIILCRHAIESWDYEGDPKDPKSYDAIPSKELGALFGSVLPVIYDLLTEQVAEEKKASASP